MFSAYFLDLILLLAKVIMYKVHGTRCTFCNFTKIMSLVGCAATCLHYIKYSLHMGLLSRYCSVCAPVLLCSVAHLLHTDFNHILCPSTLPSSSSSSFGLYLLFLSAFRRVPTTLTDIIKQVKKVGVKDTRLLDTTHSVLPNPGLIASRRETWQSYLYIYLRNTVLPSSSLVHL